MFKEPILIVDGCFPSLLLAREGSCCSFVVVENGAGVLAAGVAVVAGCCAVVVAAAVAVVVPKFDAQCLLFVERSPSERS